MFLLSVVAVTMVAGDMLVAADDSAQTFSVDLFGAFENVPSRESPDFSTAFAKIFPHLTQSKSTSRIWIGRQGGMYTVNLISTWIHQTSFKFRLDEKQNITISGVPYQFSFKLVNGGGGPAKLLSELSTSDQNFSLVYTADQDGLLLTLKIGDSESTRYYKRALPLTFYGTFENVPELSQNWAEFAGSDHELSKSSGDCKTIQFYRDNATFYNRVTYASGESMVIPFNLNNPVETVLPDGKTLRHIFSYTGGNQTVLRSFTEVVGTSKKLEIEATVRLNGLDVVYRKGALEAKRFYRRVIPAVVLGVYQSNPDNEDFITFATAIGSPELLKKTIIEVAELPDHTYVQRFSTGDDPTVEFPFTLGKPLEKSMKGRQVDYTYFFLKDNKPLLRTTYKEKNGGPLQFSVVGSYDSDGYKATYSFGDKTASRTYKRTSAKVAGDL